MQYNVPGSEPFFLPGGSTGCLLLHGFTAMPEEMRFLGDFLAANGMTICGVRLAGHATHHNDLKRIRWTDWLDNVEDGLALISRACSRRVLIGQSMGGMIALTAAASFNVDAVVALSTPYGGHLACTCPIESGSFCIHGSARIFSAFPLIIRFISGVKKTTRRIPGSQPPFSVSWMG